MGIFSESTSLLEESGKLKANPCGTKRSEERRFGDKTAWAQPEPVDEEDASIDL